MKKLIGLRLSLVFTLGVVAIGCDDPLGTKADMRRREEAIRAEREAEEREKDALASGLRPLVAEKKQNLESVVRQTESDLAGLKGDAAHLADSIKNAMEVKSPSGRELKYEAKVLNVLKDASVNVFATKYLGEDFSLIREEFIERVRNARAEESRYRKAVEEADAAHSMLLRDVKKWAGMSREQRDKEISRLKSEITALESRRNAVQEDAKRLTRRSMIGDLRSERERRESGFVTGDRLHDMDDEIRKKRYQLDYLTSPRNALDVESKATAAASYQQSYADSVHRSRIDHINRTLKPARSLADIVPEYEAKTISRLRDTISTRIAECEKAMARAREGVSTARELELAIPVSDFGELRDIRDKILKL